MTDLDDLLAWCQHQAAVLREAKARHAASGMHAKAHDAGIRAETYESVVERAKGYHEGGEQERPTSSEAALADDLMDLMDDLAAIASIQPGTTRGDSLAGAAADLRDVLTKHGWIATGERAS